MELEFFLLGLLLPFFILIGLIGEQASQALPVYTVCIHQQQSTRVNGTIGTIFLNSWSPPLKLNSWQIYEIVENEFPLINLHYSQHFLPCLPPKVDIRERLHILFPTLVKILMLISLEILIKSRMCDMIWSSLQILIQTIEFRWEAVLDSALLVRDAIPNHWGLYWGHLFFFSHETRVSTYKLIVGWALHSFVSFALFCEPCFRSSAFSYHRRLSWVSLTGDISSNLSFFVVLYNLM